MASLFGKNKLTDIASKLDTSSLKAKIAIVKTWQQDFHNGSLKKDKETSREQAYNRDFFMKVLGYEEKPASPYSFEPKATTEKGQLPDAVVGYTDTNKSIVNIAAVVELKGAGIELDRPQRREGNMSPVQQGFKYKTQYRNCPFVIVSNFWEFRLYHDNLLDYESWTLDDLVNDDNDYLLFKTWYTLLKNESFTVDRGASKTEELLSDIRIEQEEIGKKFYKVYRQSRLELLRDIYRHNKSVRSDIDTGIKKAQKIIDRIVFACFAEDRGLLPDDTVRRVIKAADTSTFGGSLWSTFKAFFEAIDSGSDKLGIPKGYDGGLFTYDAELNNLKISDEALRSVAELSDYNFDEDLSVTILGHIFEQSISDLEEIKNKVKESQNLETLAQSRRKKDGIFYTPDYIVRYIVENSLGTYLREHEEKFKEEFGLKGDIADKTYDKREKQAYAKYQGFLHNIKVVDPACGSGAFLVYVFDYLLAENKRVDDILGNLFGGDQYIKSILKNNIYGVDLNEESVEITKLSLWLKSAQKGKKLTALDDNIKCGNSLIDDSVVAGDKAFDWKKEFAEIMSQGGFDVVIGNPPYLRIQGLKDNDVRHTKYFENKFVAATGKYDIYTLFMERGFGLLRKDGVLSYILPHKFLISDFGRGIRDFIVRNRAIKSLISFGSERVFQDASTYTCIILMSHGNSSLKYRSTKIMELFQETKSTYIPYANLSFETWNLSDRGTTGVFNKLNNQKLRAMDVFRGIYQGLVSMGDDIYMLRGRIENEFFVGYSNALEETVKLEKNILRPVLKGQDIKRYSDLSSDLYVIYPHFMGDDGRTKPYEENDLKVKYPLTYEYLLKFKNILIKRKIKYKTNTKYWYALHRSREIEVFKSKKLITPQLQNYPNFTFSDSEVYCDAGGYCLILRDSSYGDILYYLTLLNSSLMWFFIKNTSSEFGGGYYYFKTKYIEPFPLPTLDSIADQKPFIANAKVMIDLKRRLYEVDARLQKLILNEFELEKWPGKLDKWWKFDFSDFVSALKLQLSLQQKDELLSLFEKYKTECSEIDTKIRTTDHEIDHLVYDLYDLTKEEIAIIENEK